MWFIRISLTPLEATIVVTGVIDVVQLGLLKANVKFLW